MKLAELKTKFSILKLSIEASVKHITNQLKEFEDLLNKIEWTEGQIEVIKEEEEKSGEKDKK